MPLEEEPISGGKNDEEEDTLNKSIMEWIRERRRLIASLDATGPTSDLERGKEEGEEVQDCEDGEDHLLEFASRLEARIKCFQRQVETTDKKVEEARRLTRTTPQSPRRKRRRKR